jgi:hypothetical protein
MMPEIMIDKKNLQVIPPRNKGPPATLQTMKGHHKQDSRKYIDHNLSSNPTDVVMLERMCASPNVTQINHQRCTTKVCPQCELRTKEHHPWVQYWPP